jgi:hypothetical protein
MIEGEYLRCQVKKTVEQLINWSWLHPATIIGSATGVTEVEISFTYWGYQANIEQASEPILWFSNLEGNLILRVLCQVRRLTFPWHENGLN